MSQGIARQLLKALVAVSPCLVIGCVSNDSSIHLLNSFPYQNAQVNGACQASTIGITAGTLDISGTTSYLLQFQLESTFQQLSNGISGEPPFQGPQRNDWTANEILYSYNTVPALNPPLADELLPLYFRLPAGATSNSFIGIDMITATAAQTLASTVRVGDVVNLNITIQLRGQLASGQKVNTNKVTYPIEVFNSGFQGCRPGDRRIPSGPCMSPGGQDGSLVGCCHDFTPPPSGCT